MVGLRLHFQGRSAMTWLPAGGFAGLATLTFWSRLLLHPVARQRLATVVAIFIEPSLKFLDDLRQGSDLFAQHGGLGLQLHDETFQGSRQNRTATTDAGISMR